MVVVDKWRQRMKFIGELYSEIPRLRFFLRNAWML